MAGFANPFGGEHWGNAEQLGRRRARRLGYRVDHVPAIGAVAQTDAGRVGHVAWVSAIGPGTVTIEEYNHSLPGGYGTRTVPVGDFRYLHLDDVAPSPLVGSDRPVVSVPDGLGESWTARVDDGGTLRLARPGRPARVVGPRGAFSPVVAPALTLDRRGRPWVAATTRGGRVLAGTLRGARFVLRAVGALGPDREPRARPVPHRATGAGGGLRRPAPSSPAASPARVAGAVPARVGGPGVVGHPHGTRARRRTAPGAPGSSPSPRTARPTPSPLEQGRLARLGGPAASITSTPALSRPATAPRACTRSARRVGSRSARSTDGAGAGPQPSTATGRRTPHPRSATSPAASWSRSSTGAAPAPARRGARTAPPPGPSCAARPGRPATRPAPPAW